MCPISALAVHPRLLMLLRHQHEVVARRQLRALGFGEARVTSWVRRGLLARVDRGVYTVGGHRLTQEGRWMAAVLATGDSAALSHRSAAALWGLRPDRSLVDVVVPSDGGRGRRRRVAVHRSAQLTDAEVTRKRGIPVTCPERTLIDLAEVVDRRTLERALDEAVRLNLTTEAKLLRATERHPGRSGAAKLSAVLTEHAAGTTATENDFEELLLAICDEHRIPRPNCQERLGRYRPDFIWPEQLLIVETDGRATHGTHRAFEDDRARDVELTTAGWRVLRFTWHQLTGEPGWVARKLGQALGI